MWKLQVLVGEREIATFRLEDDREQVLGREATAADLVVDERSVSRRHCKVLARSEGVLLTDLDSANGIYVKGNRVAETLLTAGSEARIGLASLRVAKRTGQTGMIAPGFSDTDPETFRPDLARSGDSVSGAGYGGLAKERLALLIEVGKSLSSTIEPDELLERIVNQLFELLPVQRAALVFVEPDGSLVPRVVRPPQEAEDISAMYSESIIRQVMESRTPRIIEDASADQVFNVQKSILFSDIKAALCAPLIGTGPGKPIGALYADYPGRARLYTPADLEFFAAFASLCSVAIQNAEMHLISRDLRIAAEIQKALLPEDDVELSNLTVDWTYLPSRKVGGDFYDCVVSEDGRVTFVLGDVSGKGIGAALFMARLMSFLRAAAPGEPSPAGILSRTNQLLGTRAGQDIFATAICLVVDHERRGFRYASAGHNPGLLLAPGSGTFTELPPSGTVLGFLPGASWQEHALPLDPGSLVLLYTDGIVEARDAAGRLFGIERVKEILLRNREEDVRGLLSRLKAAVEAHVRFSNRIRDDIALVLFRVGPEGASAAP